MPGNDDKTEKASPHKRMEQRKKGNIFQSKDLISGVSILLCFFALRFLIGYMLARFYRVLVDFISFGANVREFSILVASRLILDLIVNIFLLALPILFVAMLLGLLASLSQTRLSFTTSLLMPKFSRLNPIEGIKKMFSLKALVELIKSIAKVAVIAYIVYSVILGKMPDIPALVSADIYDSVKWLGEAVFDVAIYAGLGMLIIGIFDFFYQWWEYERSLMMSKQEVKDEYKQLEGNPETKGYIKRIQREMSQKRMMAGVKDADVVIRNPTHFAVALKFDPKTDTEPVVVAKGVDYLAKKIVDEAKKYNVATIENPPLARALYNSVELDGEVPYEFFEALAYIFMYLYDLNGKKRPLSGQLIMNN